MRLLFIRHGDPDYSIDSLTPYGMKEAEALAEMLKNEKIDYMYCSPLGRAKKTCEFTEKARGQKAEVKDFLHEFYGPINYPDDKLKYCCWDILPEDFVDNDDYFDRNKWFDTGIYKGTPVKDNYMRACKEFDELLAQHGYEREGNIYKAVRPNRDTIAFFCHFGITATLMSHLFSVSPMALWHNFVALPSSVTTIYTEERREGKAMWRTAEFGSTHHLYKKDLEPSFAARFCETFDSEERHD